MPQKSIKINRKDPTPGTCRIYTGYTYGQDKAVDYKHCDIRFEGPRGARQHNQWLNCSDYRKFANLLLSCGAADKKIKDDLLDLLCYLYFQSGKRVGMYLDNAQEIAAVLNLYAGEAEKQLGHSI